MRCVKCGEDLFPGQYRCDKCGEFVQTDDTKKKKKDSLIRDTEEGKENKTWH